MAVRWSSRESPAKCGNCGKLSHVLTSTSNGIASVGGVAAVLALLAGFVLESWVAAIGGLALVAAHNIWAWSRVELFPISEEEAMKAGQVSWWLVAAAFLLKLFSS